MTTEVCQCFGRVGNVVIQHRSPPPDDSALFVPEVPFKLNVPDHPATNRKLEPWTANSSPPRIPLCINVLWKPNVGPSVEYLLEHWRFAFKRSKGKQHVSPGVMALNFVLLVRSVYAQLRFMPAHRLYHRCQREAATMRGSLRCTITEGKHDEPSSLEFSGQQPACFKFGSVVTRSGNFEGTVWWAPDVSIADKHQNVRLDSAIIDNYVPARSAPIPFGGQGAASPRQAPYRTAPVRIRPASQSFESPEHVYAHSAPEGASPAWLFEQGGQTPPVHPSSVDPRFTGPRSPFNLLGSPREGMPLERKDKRTSFDAVPSSLPSLLTPLSGRDRRDKGGSAIRAPAPGSSPLSTMHASSGRAGSLTVLKTITGPSFSMYERAMTPSHATTGSADPDWSDDSDDDDAFNMFGDTSRVMRETDDVCDFVRKCELDITSKRTSMTRLQDKLPRSVINDLLTASPAIPTPMVMELSWQTPSATGTDGAAGGPQHVRHLAAWGGESVSEPTAIGVPTELASAWELPHGHGVTVRPVRHVRGARRVHVEPLSPDDWECLELNAQWLENNILSQACVATVHDVLPFWVHQRFVLRVRVVMVEPDDATDVRLTSSTELVIAPKPRNLPVPQAPDDAASSSPVSPKRTAVVLRCVNKPLAPGARLRGRCARALLHPGLMQRLGWSDGCVVVVDNALPANQPLPTAMEEQDPDMPPAAGARGPHASRPSATVADASNAQATAGTEEALPQRMCIVRVFAGARVAPEHVELGAGAWPLLELGLHSSRTRCRLRWLSHEPTSAVSALPSVQLRHLAFPHQPKCPSRRAIQRAWRSVCTDARVPVRHGSIVWLPSGSESSGDSRSWPFMLHLGVAEDAPDMDTHAWQAAWTLAALARLSVRVTVEPMQHELLPACYTCAKAAFDFTSLPGMSHVREEVQPFLDVRVLQSVIPVSPASGPLLAITGTAGSGRSMVLSSLLRHYEERHVYVEVIQVEQWTSTRLPVLFPEWTHFVERALTNQPAIVAFDDLDLLVAPPNEEVSSMRASQVAHFLADTMTQCVQRNARVVFVATAKAIESLHPVVCGVLLLGHTVALSAPDRAARAAMIEAQAAAQGLQWDTQHLPVTVAKMTEGYGPGDLRQLLTRAIHACFMRTIQHRDGDDDGASTPHHTMRGHTTDTPVLAVVDYETAKQGFTPSGLKDVRLHESDVSWDDIGGLHDVRAVLKETLEWPTRYAPFFRSAPLRLRSGLLLYGPPGTGKTMLASAVAKECGLNFISVKGPELLNKYIGASEQSVRETFDRAQSAAPCVLFFDEFDAIAPRRGHDSTGVTDRVVNQMLTQLDGVETLEGVYVLGATSRPDLVDPALLRPGRLDKLLFCPMPTESDRRDILQCLTRSMHLDASVDLHEVARACAHCTGADLQALTYNAQLKAVHEQLEAPKVEQTLVVGGKGKAEASSSDDEADGEGVDDAVAPTFRLIHGCAAEGGNGSGSGSGGASTLTQVELSDIRDSVSALTNRLQESALGASPSDADVASVGESEQQGGEGEEGAQLVTTMAHFRAALGDFRPSLSPGERARFERIYAQFHESRRVAKFESHGDDDPKEPKQTLA